MDSDNVMDQLQKNLEITQQRLKKHANKNMKHIHIEI